jgi:acyl-CoA thioester hydrolase
VGAATRSRTSITTPTSIGPVTFSLGHPSRRRPPFKFSSYTRVGFSDTDAQGIVYYGRYLPYFDLARVEYSRHLGVLAIDVGECEFVMRACTVVYDAPARFDDLLEVFIRTSRIGRSSLTTEYAAIRVEDDVLMCTAEQTLVLVELDERRSVPIPAGYRDAIERFEGADLELAVAR